jgi:hypothetical protein
MSGPSSETQQVALPKRHLMLTEELPGFFDVLVQEMAGNSICTEKSERYVADLADIAYGLVVFIRFFRPGAES